MSRQHIEALVAFVTSNNIPPMAIVGPIMLIGVVLSCVFESTMMKVFTVPVFFQVVGQLGFYPMWFGIVLSVATRVRLPRRWG